MPIKPSRPSSTATLALSLIVLINFYTTTTHAFSPVAHRSKFITHGTITSAIKARNRDGFSSSDETISTFNPLDVPSTAWDSYDSFTIRQTSTSDNSSSSTTRNAALAAATATWATILSSSTAANAAIPMNYGADFNPKNFQPVCPASDGIYRVLKTASVGLVGEENMVEYGPLVAGGLLRVRLELCVVESFFNEAVGPFVEKNGLSWVLPLHETVETFAAGTVFAFTTAFILVGSTKLVAVVMTFADVFVGVPCRLFGGYLYDRARGVPVTLDVGVGPFKARLVGPPKDSEELRELRDRPLLELPLKRLPFVFVFGSFKAAGEFSKFLQESIESVDIFVGRYLSVLTVGYIGLKFLHFKVFPDFPNYDFF